MFSDIMLHQRGHLFGWVPVCLATGIGVYFALRSEPAVFMLASVLFLALCLIWLSRYLSEAAAPLAVGIGLVAIGFVLAGLRAHHVAEPVLGWRYYGPVEGRVIALDRSQSDALRLTLDRVVLARVSPQRTPERVRLSLHGDQSASIAIVPGLRVMTTAHLSPPGGPVEPGGFDFQRNAWFERLGAVGYTRVPLVGAAPATDGQAGLRVFRIRMAISEHILRILPGDIGGFAVALTTGDRSAISQQALENLRISNLAHLLAISGLHMGLLTAFVFGAFRILLAAIPWIALRWPIHKLAAGAALIVAAGYLALSVGNVATEPAFIMVAVALGAVMIGRRALSLRSVAIAAIIVLALRPEALMGPGFQMSFAATTALVVVFGWLRHVDMHWCPMWLRPALSLLISSSVAGLATAPIAAAHFNAIAHYGLIANLLSVPLMGVLVIPAAVAALVLAPLGLDVLALWLMGLGLRWILGVADWVSALEGARGHVVGPAPWILPVLALGVLVLVLWQGRLRWGGLALMGLAFAGWIEAKRPALLIAETGNLVGMMTETGRALSKAKGAGFVAMNWLENDGDSADQPQAAARWPQIAQLGTARILHLSGKKAVAEFQGCAAQDIVIASVTVDAAQVGECLIFDPDQLRKTGAVAFYLTSGKITYRTARQVVGTRLWSNWPNEVSEGQ